MRRAVLLVLAVLVALPAAEAAASGARQPVSAGQPVSDVAVAQGGSRFAASTSDPGSRLTGTPSAPTWTLWNMDGSTRSSGSSDPDECPGVPPASTEDCDTDATEVALSSTGHRLAVASRRSGMGPSVVQVFSDSGARLAYAEVDGLVHDLALDAAGQRVAAVFTVQTGDAQDPTNGFVGLWDAATGGQLIGFTSPNPATTVDLTGRVMSVGAGNTHYLFTVPVATEFPNSAIQGTVEDVDAATHANGWAVAGYSSGFFALFSDRQGSGRGQPSVADYQKREAGEGTSANAVAIRDDATAFAVGHEGGRLRLYSLDPASQQPDTEVALLAERSGLGSLDNLEFSADGRYLAVRADTTLRLYYTGGGQLEEMWSDTRSGLVDALAIDGDGDHVVAAFGSSVLVYDALHSIVPTLRGGTHAPGQSRTYDVTYRNDGNRADALSVVAQPPSGIGVTLDPTDFTLSPGASRTVQATVTVPPTWPPGNLQVPLRLSINAGADGTPTSTLTLTVPTVHRIMLAAEDGTSKGAGSAGPAVFTVSARNDGNVAESATFSVTGLPSGWTADIDPQQATLPPGAQQNLTVTLQPPAGAADGARADVVLRHSAPGGGALELTATVGATFGVRLTGPAGVLVAPGETAGLDLVVRNDGNTADSVVVRLPALPAGWLGGFANGQSEFQVDDLESGQSSTVRASLRPPATHDSTVPVQLAFVAASLGDPSKTSTARVLVTVEEPSSTSATGGTSGGDGEGGNGIPGPGPVGVAAVLAVALLLARRRA